MTKDNQEKIQEIRQALEAVKNYNLNSIDNVTYAVHRVARNAPEWLSYLLSELDAANKRQVKLWKCPDCGFGFDAFHTDEDGGYSCPVCEIETLQQQLDAVKQENERLQELNEIINATCGEMNREIESLQQWLKQMEEENARLRKMVPKTHAQMLTEAFSALEANKEESNHD
jgi:uncharacterized Zn finger protein (UPF0148 family)